MTNSSFHTWHTFPEKSGKSWSWDQSYIEDTQQKREFSWAPASFISEMKTIDKERLVSVRKLLIAAYFYTIASSVSFMQNRRTKATYALINQTIWVGRNLLFHYQDHTGAASFTRQPYEK